MKSNYRLDVLLAIHKSLSGLYTSPKKSQKYERRVKGYFSLYNLTQALPHRDKTKIENVLNKLIEEKLIEKVNEDDKEELGVRSKLFHISQDNLKKCFEQNQADKIEKLMQG